MADERADLVALVAQMQAMVTHLEESRDLALPLEGANDLLRLDIREDTRSQARELQRRLQFSSDLRAQLAADLKKSIATSTELLRDGYPDLPSSDPTDSMVVDAGAQKVSVDFFVDTFFRRAPAVSLGLAASPPEMK